MVERNEFDGSDDELQLEVVESETDSEKNEKRMKELEVVLQILRRIVIVPGSQSYVN